jgi:transmembrane sensor
VVVSMTGIQEKIEEEAVAWVIRLRTAESEDWEAFTAWLEADPAHAAAYEGVALLDQDVDSLPATRPRPILPSSPPPTRRGVSRRMVFAGSIAAALVAAIGVTTLVRSDSTYEVATRAGERRTFELADGSRIHVNGGSRIVLDRAEPRFARLEQGEALFTVVHDESRPFNVAVGDARLHDLGTVFNVERGRDGTIEVQVAEGAVRYSDEDERVDLRPGMTLRKGSSGRAVTGTRSAEAITGWRQGRLSYSNATVAEIAEDLARNLGLEVTADASVAQRRFSGVIVLDRDPQLVLRRVSALLEVQARQQGEGWLLSGGRETP